MFDLFLTVLHVVLVSGMILISVVVLKRSKTAEPERASGKAILPTPNTGVGEQEQSSPPAEVGS